MEYMHNPNSLPLSIEELNILKESADQNPSFHCAIARHYLRNEESEMFLEHLFKSFLLGSKIGFNMYGYYFYEMENNKDEAIKNYEKAIFYNQSKGAMWNLYLEFKNSIRGDYYLEMAIDNEYGLAYYEKAMLLKENNEYYMDYLKKGAKLNDVLCIKEVLSLYKIRNYSKYIKYLKFLVKLEDKKAINEYDDACFVNNENRDYDDINKLLYLKINDNDKFLDEIENKIKENDDEKNIYIINLAIEKLHRGKKEIEEIICMANTLKNEGNMIGYLIMGYYYMTNKLDEKLSLENLETAKKIDSDFYITYTFLGMHYSKFRNKKTEGKRMENYLISFEKSDDENIIIEMLNCFLENNNYDCYSEYYGKLSKSYRYLHIKNVLEWLKTQTDKNLLIILIKKNLSIGLINLCNHHEDYKEICRDIDSKIIIKEYLECSICSDFTDLHTIMPCLNHKICIDCFKKIKNECPFCKFSLYDMSRQCLI